MLGTSISDTCISLFNAHNNPLRWESGAQLGKSDITAQRVSAEAGVQTTAVWTQSSIQGKKRVLHFRGLSSPQLSHRIAGILPDS